MSAHDESWVIGDSVLEFQWASDGNQLLIQEVECFRLFDFREGPREHERQEIDRSDVIGWGAANDRWWFLVKDEEQALFRCGREPKGVVIEGASAAGLSHPVLSPDGKLLACVHSKINVSFWSADNGRRLFDVKTRVGGHDDDLFGPLEINRLIWSADSRYVAVEPSFPVTGILIINVSNYFTSECVK